MHLGTRHGDAAVPQCIQTITSLLFSFSLFRINVGHGDELLREPFCQAGYIPASEANVQLVGH